VDDFVQTALDQRGVMGWMLIRSADWRSLKVGGTTPLVVDSTLARDENRFVSSLGKNLMIRLPLVFALFVLMTWSISALACDPNEECSSCLASAFGHCIQHGNDPVCEVRKRACQVAPPIVNTPGSPFGPGGPLQQGGPVPINQVQQCISNLSACPAQIIATIGYQTVKPIVDQYIGFLQNQAGSNLYGLDQSFVNQIQRFYSVDLHNVRYAININTVHGSNITIGNTIYFVKGMNFSDPNDAWTLYHELEHVVQYAQRGGVEPFLSEYILKAGGSVLRGGNSVDIHDNIDLENAANAKANQVANAAPSPVSFPGGPPPQPPGPSGFPANQLLGSICRTPVLVCLLPGPGPQGIGCFCGTPYGPSNGVVTRY
jgi:hypothetical protein